MVDDVIHTISDLFAAGERFGERFERATLLRFRMAIFSTSILVHSPYIFWHTVTMCYRIVCSVFGAILYSFVKSSFSLHTQYVQIRDAILAAHASNRFLVFSVQGQC